jgi:hypothetical protein
MQRSIPAPRGLSVSTSAPIEPLLGAILVVVAGTILAVGSNPLLAGGILLGAVLRTFLPNSKYIAATLVIAPVLFAFDRYHAPISYYALGYRQIFGAGAGIYLALLVTGLFGHPKLKLCPTDVALLLLFGLLGLSVAFPSADFQAPVMFASNTLPVIAALYAGRRLGGKDTDLVLDAIIAAAVCAVIGRWLQEGPGPSSYQFRAGTNWYLGAAVYASLPLTLAWGLALPTLYRIRTEARRWRSRGRLVALALLSAELAFLQVKTVFVVIVLCTIVSLRLGSRKKRGRPSNLTMRKIAISMVLLILATFAYTVINVRIDNLYGSFLGNESDRLRVESMKEHLGFIADRPFGYGFSGLFEAAVPRTAQTSHNVFIDLAGDASLFAPLALAFALVSGMSLVMKKGRALEPSTPEWWTWTRFVLGGTTLVGELLINGPTFYREFPIPSAVLPFVFIGSAIAWCSQVHPGHMPAAENASPVDR